MAMLSRSRLLPACLFLLFGIAGAVSAWICRHALGSTPHIPDEVAYVFQARIFASGRLWLNPPSVPEAFRLDHIVLTGDRWCSIYPPGWPTILMIGSWLKAEWLINPLVLALSVAGVWILGRRLYDEKTATLAALLYACSPFTLLMGAGFMAHQATLCSSLWCLVALVSRRHVTAGFLAGIALLCRPFTAVFLLFPAFLWQRKSWRLHSPGILVAVLLTFLYNTFVFENPLRSGYSFDTTSKNDYFFVAAFIQNAPWYFRSLNQCLWGWPFPNLLLLLPLLLRRVRKKEDCVLVLCSAALVLAHCFFYWTDIVYSGPRYAYEAMGLFSLLAARSILSSSKRWIVIPASVLLIAYPLFTRLPDQIRYHSQIYHGQAPFPIPKDVGNNALIFVSGKPDVLASFFLRSDGSRIFVRNLPRMRDEIRRAYPRKETWIVEVELEPLPGPNLYTDRWKLRSIHWSSLPEF